MEGVRGNQPFFELDFMHIDEFDMLRTLDSIDLACVFRGTDIALPMSLC
jgi:hypothetical protein